MLSAKSAEIVRATLPVVRDHGPEITTQFYSDLFAGHPELLDLFNLGNQANGDQQRALAAAVVAFAEYLVGERQADFTPIAERVAHKHVSLGVQPAQYTIVGRYLLGAVAKVLGDAVTDEVRAAWDEVYWLCACHLIAAEAQLYQRGEVESTSPWRDWRVAKRVAEAEDTVSFTLVPDDGGPVPAFRPGQYVSVAVTLPDGRRQPRQYSLSQGPGRGSLRITVRRVRGADGAPDGRVSNHLCDRVAADDILQVGPVAGDVVLDQGDDPVVLVSAGIGVTPMAGMLDHIGRTQPFREVVAVHADRSPERHALHDDVAHARAQLRSFEQLSWYEQGATGDARPGLLNVDEIPLPENALVYLCGPLPFMASVRAGLRRRGVPAERIFTEVFGAGMLTGEG
ncbi:oxidoreductase FAD/NAD(P)-binding domain-containing protein [Saccharomonospora azurea SZMC 14600]|uniref:globin domain-containing protein n=1 Tax=Saccharomonospora azurea TaxID=40988 RepID=UPI00023FFBC6|nr:globin domain-containing protein [Saccharomonospora azurea]EHK87674.1 oxidoreductase FAD/NAD(P)-binding domain-containing protein [Saccharomonospora azurea SZMC 14600]